MKDRKPDFYLSSSEGHIVGEPRMCFVLQRIRYATRSDCLLINISPPIDGRRYDCAEIDKVIIATRFKGDSLFPPNRWPLDVYVLRFAVADVTERDSYETGELINFAWGEIYQKREDVPLIDVNRFGG